MDTNNTKLIIGIYYRTSSDNGASIEQLKISLDRINQNAKSTIILSGDLATYTGISHPPFLANQILSFSANFLIPQMNTHLSGLSWNPHGKTAHLIRKTYHDKKSNWRSIRQDVNKHTLEIKDHYHSSSTNVLCNTFTDRLLLKSVKKNIPQKTITSKMILPWVDNTLEIMTT